MKIGSLFSGGGLGDFGFMAAGMDIAWQCEIDPYCQKILAIRYPESKKYTDIKTLKGVELEPVNIITGGFPCQPFSVAGQQMGKSDDRHLWPEMFRIIQEVKPSWVIGENVSGFVDMALDDVCANLESAGYETTTLIFPAHALGSWHRRERVWIIANATNTRFEGVCKREEPANEDVSDTGRKYGAWNKSELETNKTKWSSSKLSIESGCERFRRYWKSEPAVGRVANGIADRVHRLKMLGNGQVPACTYVIGKMIMDIEATLALRERQQ